MPNGEGEEPSITGMKLEMLRECLKPFTYRTILEPGSYY
jgi:hypothetical protein